MENTTFKLFGFAITIYLLIGWVLASIIATRWQEAFGRGDKRVLAWVFALVCVLWPRYFAPAMEFTNEPNGPSEPKEVHIEWKRGTAGMKLPGDCLIRYDNDPDVRIGRCMINDGWYIPTSEIEQYLD